MTDIIATEVMRRGVHTVPVDMPLPELGHAFTQFGVSGFPVVDGERLVGVVSRSDLIRQLDLEHETAARTSDFYRDAEGFHEVPVTSSAQIANRVGERMEHLTVESVMNREVFAVPPDQPLRVIAQMMLDRDIHRILVTQDGRLLGVISASDFVRLYADGKLKPA